MVGEQENNKKCVPRGGKPGGDKWGEGGGRGGYQKM